MKKIEKYLYEKEIADLKKQNTKLLVQRERAEKHSREYEELCKENRILAKKYREGIQKLKTLEKELETELERLRKQ